MSDPIVSSQGQAPPPAGDGSSAAVGTLVELGLLTADGRAAERAAGAPPHPLIAELAAVYGGRRADGEGSGLLLVFERPLDAVRFALAFHRRLVGSGDGVSARAAIHLSEIRKSVAGRPAVADARAREVVARVCAVGRPGHVLLTQGAFELARRAVVGDQSAAGLEWRAYGAWGMSGLDEAMELFEVGEPDIAPLAPPGDTEAARRVENDEVTMTGEWVVPDHRRRRWRRALIALGGVAALGLVGVVVALLLPPGLPERPTILMLPIEDLRAATDDSALAAALSSALEARLAAADRLDLVAGGRVGELAGELPDVDTFAPDTLRRLRRLTGADFVVSGSVLGAGASGERVERFFLRLQRTRHEDTSVRVAVDGGSVAEVVERAAAELERRMGLTD